MIPLLMMPKRKIYAEFDELRSPCPSETPSRTDILGPRLVGSRIASASPQYVRFCGDIGH